MMYTDWMDGVCGGEQDGREGWTRTEGEKKKGCAGRVTSCEWYLPSIGGGGGGLPSIFVGRRSGSCLFSSSSSSSLLLYCTDWIPSGCSLLRAVRNGDRAVSTLGQVHRYQAWQVRRIQ